MPRKCPPGTICIENITIIFGLIIIGILLMYIWNPPKGNNQQVVIKEQVKERNENIDEEEEREHNKEQKGKKHQTQTIKEKTKKRMEESHTRT